MHEHMLNCVCCPDESIKKKIEFRNSSKSIYDHHQSIERTFMASLDESKQLALQEKTIRIQMF